MPLAQIQHHTFFTNGLSPSSVVLDLGANRGHFSQAVLDRFGCRCYGIEPNPALFKELPTDPRFQALNLAVAAETGTLPFHIAEDCEASSLLSKTRTNATDTIDVQVVTLEALVNLLGLDRIDLLKVDIEGAEIGVLESCAPDLLHRVGQLTIELHDFCGLTPAEDAERVIRRLEELDFFFIPVWRRGYGDTLFVNRRSGPVNRLQRLWARHVTRNWWGVKRIFTRWIGGPS